jgi:hypothetical protein
MVVGLGGWKPWDISQYLARWVYNARMGFGLIQVGSSRRPIVHCICKEDINFGIWWLVLVDDWWAHSQYLARWVYNATILTHPRTRTRRDLVPYWLGLVECIFHCILKEDINFKIWWLVSAEKPRAISKCSARCRSIMLLELPMQFRQLDCRPWGYWLSQYMMKRMDQSGYLLLPFAIYRAHQHLVKASTQMDSNKHELATQQQKYAHEMGLSRYVLLNYYCYGENWNWIEPRQGWLDIE